MSNIRNAFHSGLATEYLPVIPTRTAGDSSLASSAAPLDKNAWDEVINHKLIEWGMQAEHGVEGDEFAMPTKASVRAAIELISSVNLPISDRTLPNGDGGISLEWEQGEGLFKVEILFDGRLQQTAYQGARLVSHAAF